MAERSADRLAQEAVEEAVAPAHRGPDCHELLGRLAEASGVRRYLEIGLGDGTGFARIPCEHAVGIDPELRLAVDAAAGKIRVSLFRLTGNEFFHLMRPRRVLGGPADLVVLGGGTQRFEFVLRDFLNAEALCTPDSIIAIRNVLPSAAAMADRDFARAHAGTAGMPFAGAWTGDLWKMIPLLRTYRPDLALTLVEARPFGLALVSGLNPTSRVLRRRYDAIVRAVLDWPNDAAALARLYDEMPVVATENLLEHLGGRRFGARPSRAARLPGRAGPSGASG